MPQIIETPLKNLTEPWENHRGRHVEEFIKRELLARASVFHYDREGCRYLAFASPEARDAYLADPKADPSLLLATITIPLGHTASHAYPGHEGAQLRSDVDTLAAEATDRDARITAAELTLRAIEDSVGHSGGIAPLGPDGLVNIIYLPTGTASGTVYPGERGARTEESLAKLDDTVTSLTSSVKELESAHDTLSVTVSGLGSAVGHLSDDIGHLHTSLTALDTRVSDSATAITALDGRVDANTSAITSLDTRTGTNSAAITALGGRVDTNTEEISALDTRTTPILVASEEELQRMIEAGECEENRMYYTEDTD